MRVLLTGACGNLGHETLDALLARGHRVRTLDLDSARNRARLAPYAGRIEAMWGDLAQPELSVTAVRDVDAIVHDAAILPPRSEREHGLAYRVNVTGTKNLLDAARRETPAPRFVLASSIAVFGVTQPAAPPPRRASSETHATDHYSCHKLECERAVARSGLRYCILRIGAAPPAKLEGGDPGLLAFMFDRSLESRVEFVHPRDVAFAQARTLEVEEAWDKVLLIGGGPGCQVKNRDLVNGLLEAMGIGALPDAAFAPRYLYGDWLDTEESQRLLGFQRHTFADFLAEKRAGLGARRALLRVVAPLVRRYLLSHSAPLRRPRALA